MRVLLDENLPQGLKRDLLAHDVSTVPEMGWAGTSDADILKLAGSQFDVLVTADRNLEFQNDVAAADVGVVVVMVRDTRLQTVRLAVPAVLRALETIRPGRVIRVEEA